MIQCLWESQVSSRCSLYWEFQILTFSLHINYSSLLLSIFHLSEIPIAEGFEIGKCGTCVVPDKSHTLWTPACALSTANSSPSLTLCTSNFQTSSRGSAQHPPWYGCLDDTLGPFPDHVLLICPSVCHSSHCSLCSYHEKQKTMFSVQVRGRGLKEWRQVKAVKQRRKENIFILCSMELK